MKTNCIIIVFILLSSRLIAQDIEPQPLKFIWGSSSQPRPLDVDSFQQNNIITGFQWSGTPKMNHYLHNNATASGSPTLTTTDTNTYLYWEDGTIYNSKMYLSSQPCYLRQFSLWGDYAVDHCRMGVRNAPAMVYEPTLLIPAGHEGEFNVRQYDSTNAIFGFHHIVGEILPAAQHTNENYNRLHLRKNIDTGIVLSDIWPHPQFFTNEGCAQSGGYQGQKWNLTINLRRYDIAEDSNLDSAVILEIKIPYRSRLNTSSIIRSIKFDSIPYPTIDSSASISYPPNNDFRGYELKRYWVDNILRDTVLRIYRSMLPIDSTKKDITISAQFLTYKYGLIDQNNPPLNNNYKNSNIEYIDSLDIEVKYNGITDVCIDYIKIESEEAYFWSRGAVDSLGVDWVDTILDVGPRNFKIYPKANDTISVSSFTEYHSTYDVLQSWLTRFPKYNLNGTMTSPVFRFYAQEWESDNPVYWWQLRYLNLLTNGLTITRDNPIYPKLYEYYTKCPNRWIGVAFSGYDVQLAVPYARSANDNPLTSMYLKSGYFCNDCTPYDTLYSYYEIKLPYCDPYYLVKDDSYYFGDRIDDGPFLQETWERALFKGYCNYEENHNYQLLYSDKPWWTYYFLHSLYIHRTETDTVLSNTCYRIHTAEEQRLLIYSSILKGAKGFIYDGDQNNRLPHIGAGGQMGIGDNTKLDSLNDLYSDEVGTDFVDSVHNTWNAYNYVKLDILSETFGVPKSRIYIGTKSIRTELARIHQWLHANESILMRLRLVAWCSKGFRMWGNQDSSISTSSSLLERFISFDTTKLYAKRLYYPWSSSTNITKEAWDSTFIDITLLRDSSNHDLSDSVFYVGIQNRRTDPLVRPMDSVTVTIRRLGEPTKDSCYIDPSMKFYSTAEFDKYCDEGGYIIVPDTVWRDSVYDFDYAWAPKFRDSSYWRDLYWKRLGCRYITIPFNYVPPDSLYSYKLIINELTADTTFDSTWAWWRQDRFYRQIMNDTIDIDSFITLKMLPGEGRILKVTVHREPLQCPFNGILAHSNQNKLIVYPIQQNGVLSDSIYRYHLVYHKKNNYDSTRYSVYYRRSHQVTKYQLEQDPSLKDHLAWDDEICVSEYVMDESSNTFLVPNSYYPSISIRTITNNSLTYACIVYSCDTAVDISHYDGTIAVAFINLTNDNVYFSCPEYGYYNINDIVPTGFMVEPYIGKNIHDWGTPVIGASYYNNFIAWADSIHGIRVATQALNVGCYHYVEKNSMSDLYYGTKNNNASHPSIPAYYNCNLNLIPIAWQQDVNWTPDSSNTHNSIIHTRVIQSNRSPYKIVVYGPDTTMYSTGGQYNNLYPLVYGFKLPISSRFYYMVDRIAWESHTTGQQDNHEIQTAVIQYMQDSLKRTTLYTTKYNKSRIIGYDSYLSQPDLGQGKLLNAGSMDSCIILSFRDSLSSGANEIYNLNIKYYSVFEKAYYENLPNSYLQYIADGNYAHLSKHYEVFGSNDYWRNRIIFNPYNNTNDVITTSRYYRTSSDADINPVCFNGFSSNTLQCLTNIPLLDDSKIKINLPSKMLTDTIIDDETGDTLYSQYHESLITDSLFSDWFAVGDLANLSFDFLGIDTSRIDVLLQRFDGEQIVNMPITPSSSSYSAFLQDFVLINGQNNEYRLAFINKDTNSQYSEALYLHGIPIENQPSMRTSDYVPKIIDLGGKTQAGSEISLSLYPNPADEVIYCTAYGIGELLIKVFNSQGSEVYRNKVKSGQGFSINTSEMPIGAYFIRVENADWLNFNSATESFVICR